ncbi:dioxygenase [[Leptolyngbya] sp. PCC 7376]|uniref:dioxygenase n=1 Tax=[Leptolyngbya] sp. PCC 7376 TaxID=111781 RepID=UPI00029EECD3|nr:dioxygenase [[Leptolyngbya] sp. PCC 7376]AFY36759.1 dioxygenase [[Leptolyngbya] sp. PCC 7376]
MNLTNATWQKTALSWEYHKAANPTLTAVPIRAFPASLHESGETRIIPLDLATELGTSYPATTPNLLANFIRIKTGEQIEAIAAASSEVFYVMRGSGRTETEYGTLEWRKGDSFTLPMNTGVTHYADDDAALYWVHDSPMLAYLGVQPTTPRFEPAFYSGEFLTSEIERIREEGIRRNLNRNGVILGNPESEDTRTVTHTMWSLYNLVPPHSSQKPHRHNSIALDLAVSAKEDTYTLIGKSLDGEGNIINPIKMKWEPNSVFVTPPGLWHSHHNESDEDAYVFPVQDAGMQIYMRTLDIQFAK